MTFQEPDAKTLARMTPASVGTLVEALKSRRQELTAPLDEQIKYYEDLLVKMRKERTNGETPRRV